MKRKHAIKVAVPLTAATICPKRLRFRRPTSSYGFRPPSLAWLMRSFSGPRFRQPLLPISTCLRVEIVVYGTSMPSFLRTIVLVALPRLPGAPPFCQPSCCPIPHAGLPRFYVIIEISQSSGNFEDDWIESATTAITSSITRLTWWQTLNSSPEMQSGEWPALHQGGGVGLGFRNSSCSTNGSIDRNSY